MIFYLVRHGQTNWNLEGKIQGKTDIPLNEAGLRQAEFLAAALENRKLEAVYASPLSRALATAELVARQSGLTVQILPQLREVDFGLWEGKGWREVEASYGEDFRRWDQDPARAAPTGGESRESCKKRCRQAIEELIRREEHCVALVAHGGILVHLIDYLLRNQMQRERIIVKNARISTVEYDPQTGLGTLLVLNDTAHLALSGIKSINKYN